MTTQTKCENYLCQGIAKNTVLDGKGGVFYVCDECYKSHTMGSQLKKKYVFVEPHITGGSSTVEITGEQILKFMKNKKREEFKELSDEQLIESFLLTHWAKEQNEKTDNDIIADWIAEISIRDNGAVFLKDTNPKKHAPVTYGDLRKLMEG